jgi:hypothetical protein
MSNFEIALALKLKLLFEDETTFLTFPLGMSYSAKALNFLSNRSESKLSPQEQINYSADFARLTNIIPEDGPLWSPDASIFLWDEFKSIIRQSIFAKDNLSKDEKKILDHAIDYLTDLKKEGDTYIAVDSKYVKKYIKYKNLFDYAKKAYLDEKISVENSTGDLGRKLRDDWLKFRESELKDAIAKSEKEWIDKGFRNQVEDCQNVRENLEYKLYLNNIREVYLNHLEYSEIPDLASGGITFCSTLFSPQDSFDPKASWSIISMTKEEIESLSKKAPAVLNKLFISEEQDTDFDFINIEYKNVVIIRPWFNISFFKERFWKLPKDELVSNGKIPRKGRIPAYVSSMLVIRKIEVFNKKGIFDSITDFFESLYKSTLKDSQRSISFSYVPQKGSKKLTRLMQSGQVDRHLISKIRIRPILNIRSSYFPFSLSRNFDAKNGGIKIMDYISIKTNEIRLNYSVKFPKIFKRNLRMKKKKFQLDEFKVVAFVCNRLPRSPRPDPKLKWN